MSANFGHGLLAKTTVWRQPWTMRSGLFVQGAESAELQFVHNSSVICVSTRGIIRPIRQYNLEYPRGEPAFVYAHDFSGRTKYRHSFGFLGQGLFCAVPADCCILGGRLKKMRQNSSGRKGILNPYLFPFSFLPRGRQSFKISWCLSLFNPLFNFRGERCP